MCLPATNGVTLGGNATNFILELEFDKGHLTISWTFCIVAVQRLCMYNI